VARKTLDERFWAKVDKTGDCWLWAGSKSGGGYGQFWNGYTNVGAHRYAYERKHGPVPDGYSVLHKCATPACVNPDHLYQGSAFDNSFDASMQKDRRKGRIQSGRGSITDRGDGRFDISVSLGFDPVTQRYRRKTKRVHGTINDARKVLVELNREVDSGRLRATEGTVAHLMTKWLEASEPNLSPSTLRRYRILLRVHILPGLGEVRLSRLSSADLDGFYAQLRDKGLAPATVGQVHAIIRRALNQAIKWGWLAVSPAKNATPPRLSRPDHRPPDPGSVLRLIDAAFESRAPEFGTFLRVAAATGARRGELCALRWIDVDAENGRLRVAHSIVEAEDDSLILKDTKSHSIRWVSVDVDTLAVLAVHRQSMEARAVAMEETLAEDAYVFSNSAAGRAAWRPSGVTQTFTRLRDRCGLGHVRFHDLRHASATQLLGAGVDVRTVAGRLGHRNAAVTLNVYSHFLPAKDRDAAELVGQLLAGD
jgi:integrase